MSSSAGSESRSSRSSFSTGTGGSSVISDSDGAALANLGDRWELPQHGHIKALCQTRTSAWCESGTQPFSSIAQARQTGSAAVLVMLIPAQHGGNASWQGSSNTMYMKTMHMSPVECAQGRRRQCARPAGPKQGRLGCSKLNRQLPAQACMHTATPGVVYASCVQLPL